MSISIERWVGFAAVLNLAMLAILSGRPNFTNASRPVRGITNPILAMEVIRDLAEVDAVLGDAPSPDREAMRIKQYADFGFILAYGSLFVLIGRLLAPKGRAIAISATTLGLVAANLDVVENVRILHLLNATLAQTTQGMINAVRYPSLAKWTLVSLAMGMMALLFWRTGRIGLRMVGALDLCAALLGLYGVYDNAFLGWSGLPMVGGFLGLAILYFRPGRRGDTTRNA